MGTVLDTCGRCGQLGHRSSAELGIVEAAGNNCRRAQRGEKPLEGPPEQQRSDNPVEAAFDELQAAAAAVERTNAFSPPKLIGIITLPHSTRIALQAGAFEEVRHVAFDTRGRAWGLVTLLEPVAMLSATATRLTFVRWAPFNEIPFASEPWKP